MSCTVYYSPVKYFIAVPPGMLIKLTIGSQIQLFPLSLSFFLSCTFFFFFLNKQAVFPSTMPSNGSCNIEEGSRPKAD